MQIKSALITDASGSLGGMTASRNRSGLYLRSRVVPIDPSTTRQNEMRSIMASLNSSWIDATPEARETWHVYAANVLHTPRFCGPIYLTGQNQYIRSNSPRLQSGLPVIGLAPTVFDTGQPLTIPNVVEITQGSPPNAFNIEVPFVDQADADGDAAVYMSRPYSPSRRFFVGPFQFMFTAPYSALDSTVTFNGSWDDQFTDYNEPVPGEHYSLRFNAMTDDGRLAHQEIYPVDWTEDIPV